MEQKLLSETDWLKLENLKLKAELEQALSKQAAYEHERTAQRLVRDLNLALADLAKEYGTEGWTFSPEIKGWTKLNGKGD